MPHTRSHTCLVLELTDSNLALSHQHTANTHIVHCRRVTFAAAPPYAPPHVPGAGADGLPIWLCHTNTFNTHLIHSPPRAPRPPRMCLVLELMDSNLASVIHGREGFLLTLGQVRPGRKHVSRREHPWHWLAVPVQGNAVVPLDVVFPVDEVYLGLPG